MPITGDYSIAGANRLAGKKNLGGLHTPTLFVVGMDLLIPPPNGILKPFVAGESQGYFNVRTDVGLANTLIQVGDEDDCG
jgi:hypothetical protein